MNPLFYFLHIVPEVLLLYGLRADPAPPDGLLLRLLQHLLVHVEDDGSRGLHLLHDGPLGGLVPELETKVHPKVRNHGEGPYKGLLLVESGYYRFHIEDTIKTLC